MRIALHVLIATLLTLLTQIGGVIWLISRAAPKRKLTAFFTLYFLTSIALSFLAPLWERERLPCFAILGNVEAQSPIYCALNRNFVDRDLARSIRYIGQELAYDGYGPLAYLDGSFPIGDMPLLPHLSHSDGKKLDLALPYRNAENQLSNGRSPIGYFAFEYPETEQCPKSFPTLRWDLHWLQWVWPDYELDELRLTMLVEALLERPQELGAEHRITKIFLEPHLVARTGLADERLRFQGCRAARHDDHIHIEID